MTTQVVILMLIISSVSLNIACIVLVSRNKRFLKDVTTPLLVGLFVSGFMQGLLIGIPSLIIWWVPEAKNLRYYIDVIVFNTAWLTFVNFASVASLGMSKFLSTVRPLRWLQTTMRKTICGITCTIWIFGIALAMPVLPINDSVYIQEVLLPMLNQENKALDVYILILGASLFISVAVTVVSNIGLFVVVWSQVRKMRRTFGASTDSQRDNSIISALKSSRSVISVLLIRIILYVPLLVLVTKSVFKSSLAFYTRWALINGPLVDAACFIVFSKSIRRMLCKRCVSNSVNTTTNEHVRDAMNVGSPPPEALAPKGEDARSCDKQEKKVCPVGGDTNCN